MKKPIPRCETCGLPCKRRKNGKKLARFCSMACVPLSVRQAGGYKGRATYAYRIRAEKFRDELKRLEGRRVTSEALFEVFNRIYRRGFNTGWRTGRLNQRPAIVEAA